MNARTCSTPFSTRLLSTAILCLGRLLRSRTVSILILSNPVQGHISVRNLVEHSRQGVLFPYESDGLVKIPQASGRALEIMTNEVRSIPANHIDHFPAIRKITYAAAREETQSLDLNTPPTQ